MATERVRVLGLALVSLTLIVAAAWVMDWFTMEITAGGLPGLAKGANIGFDLRTVHATAADGTYGSAPLTEFGFYATGSTATLWSSVVLSVLIAVQCGSRLLSGQANPTMTRVGYLVAAGVFLAAVFTAFLFGPSIGDYSVGIRQLNVAFSIDRTLAPLVMLAGVAIGIYALYSAQAPDDPLPEARALPTAPAPRLTMTSMPIPRAATPLPEPTDFSVPRTSTAIPHPLRGKLKFGLVTAEITRGGVDARREDGSLVLVVWPDVVGVVARRTPPELTGATFVDLVSTAGSTLRLLPWSRVTGDQLIERDPEARARKFVELVIKHCPDCKLDRATREYLEQPTGQAAQLPDEETLAAHDARLA